MSPESQFRESIIGDREMARLTVSAVARRLGIAPGTLRTWDRRYGLGPSEHCVGEHRRYSKVDLARLLYMHKLVISGFSASDAARLAVAHGGEFDGSELSSILCIDGQLVASLFRAAQVLDRKSVEQGIRSHIVKEGVASTWVSLLVPLLCLIGEEWERNGEGIASEHMVSDVIKKILGERILVEHPRNDLPVLLACVGEEMHSLAITALAATLAERNIQVQFLGARTPIEAICEVIRRSAPPAIFLWAQVAEHASLATIAALPSVRPSPRIILGGPGWANIKCNGTHFAADLEAACREISQALGL